MSSIGAVLKEARTKKSISLEDVQSKTKIHPRVLQLLEEDKFEKLPSPLFVKSFLKSYAEFLEIQPDELLTTYEKEKQKDPEQILFIKSADPGAGQGFHPFYAVAGVCLVLLLLSALTGHPSRWKAAWPMKPKPPKTVVSKSKKFAPIKVRREDIQEVSAVAKEGPSQLPGIDWLNSVSQGNFPKIKDQTPLTLEIKALEGVWVRVTADGSVVYQGVLKKGTAQQWTAKNTLDLWTGNASSMLMTLNKTPLGSPGKGIAKKMAVSREGIRLIAPLGR